MKLWIQWWKAVWNLRPACSRFRTFLWFVTSMAGLTVRMDLFGVTSIVRALGLRAYCYDRILDFFHGTGLKLDRLTEIWSNTVLKIFPSILRVNGRILLVGDGLKVPKEGKKMPAVKKLHQELMAVGAAEIPIIIGGIIPEEDYDALYAMGVKQIFTPGDTVQNIVRCINSLVEQNDVAT